MSNKAGNFAYLMKITWAGGRGSEENAVKVAKRQQAVRVRPFAIEGFIEVEGDIPCSLWRWPDGSEYVVADDGSSIESPKGVGAPVGGKRKYKDKNKCAE